VIDEGLLAQVKAALQGIPGAAATDNGNLLRSRFPGLKLAFCSDDDIPPRIKAVDEVFATAEATGATQNPRYRLYFIDAGEHCLKLTTDADVACGLVVAACDED
jgi:hypothetical protein